MGRSDHVEISTPHHCLLYENRQGQPIRTLARIGLTISVTVLLCLGWAYWRSRSGELGHSLSTGSMIGFFIVAAGAAVLAKRSWQMGQCFVLHFEVWPRSHLAIVRTAGIWREQIHMVPWRDLQSLDAPVPSPEGRPDPWVHIRLISGRKLIFDHQNGTAPQSWAALGRFLQKRSLPETTTGQWATQVA